MVKKKILVQFDGSNFYNKVKKILPQVHLTNFDYHGLAKLLVKSDQYVTGRRAFTRFMAKHGGVVDYIAVLAEGKTEAIETPQKEIVFDTLQRLNNNLIMGELGAGSEEMETGLDLAMLVENAAQRHAVRIGQDPDQYLLKISDQKYTMISLHP